MSPSLLTFRNIPDSANGRILAKGTLGNVKIKQDALEFYFSFCSFSFLKFKVLLVFFLIFVLFAVKVLNFLLNLIKSIELFKNGNENFDYTIPLL